ncbi:unnamed protein product [Closterium sp. NIES-65]|nr:unnamed protein product [Closterium sp. NIES-65]
MPRGDDLRRLTTVVLRHGLPRTELTAQSAQIAQSPLRLPRHGLPRSSLCPAPISPPLAEPPVASGQIPAPAHPPSRIFPAASRFLSCRYASTSVHSTFSAATAASPAALAAGSAAATKPIESHLLPLLIPLSPFPPPGSARYNHIFSGVPVQTGRTATVWGIFHQEGVPVAAEARIGGANKPCWKAVRESEGEGGGDDGEEEAEGNPARDAPTVHASV